MMSRQEMLANEKVACEALIHDLTHPEIVPLPPPLVVPPPDLTPPDFDAVAFRKPMFPPAKSAAEVTQGVEGITAGSPAPGFQETNWRNATLTPKRSADEVNQSVCGSTHGTQAGFAEAAWRQPALMPSAPALYALGSAKGGAASALAGALENLPTISTFVSAETVPDLVSTSLAARETAPPPPELAILQTALAASSPVPSSEAGNATEPEQPSPILSANALPAALSEKVSVLAGLPRDRHTPTSAELMQANLESMQEVGPVPAYIAYLSMTDEEADHLAREQIDTLSTPEARQADNLRTAARAKAMIESLEVGDYETCNGLAWQSQPGLGSDGTVVEEMFKTGDAMLQRIARLAADGFKTPSSTN